MLALWQVDRQFIYGQLDSTLNATGASSYTVGIGGNLAIRRPEQIDYMFYRLDNIDYPMERINSFEEYQSIPLKALATMPSAFYYNSSYILGTLYVYPQPSSGTFHIGTRVSLPQYTALTDSITLPPEYEMVIRFSLAELLGETMGVGTPPGIVAMARTMRRIMKRNNLRIGTLSNGGPRFWRHSAILAGGVL